MQIKFIAANRLNMIIRARAPLRLGISGGGTDVSPYCDIYGGNVINAAINKYAYTTIETNNNNIVKFVSADLGLSAEYNATSVIQNDGVLDLYKAVYNRIVKQFNNGEALSLTITTYCEAPAGSGLGSSSALVVSMITAYSELLNMPLGEYDLAHLAYEVERNDAGLNGGKQDQYAAAFGGFNFIEFNADDHVLVNPLRVKNWIISELEASLVLFYTGQSRESANIIDEQSKNVKIGKEKSIDALHQLKIEAIRTKESLLKGEFDQLAKSMQRSWDYKKRTANSISNKYINDVFDIAIQAGATAGKISGAGGGGFMMFLVEPICRMQVIKALEGLDGHLIDCSFTKHGAHAWKVN